MHFSLELASGFYWKRFQEILKNDESLHNVEVPLSVCYHGHWPLRRYFVRLPETIPFEQASYVSSRLGEIIRQAKDPGIFTMGRMHDLRISFSYEETNVTLNPEQWYDISWDPTRAEAARISLMGWWEERTGYEAVAEAISDDKGGQTTLIRNPSTPSTAVSWGHDANGVLICVFSTHGPTLEMLLAHITQMLRGSVWGEERYSSE